MADVNEICQSLIADYLKVSYRQVQGLSIIASYYYSEALFEEMSECLPDTVIEALKNSNIKIGLDSLDCIFICSFEISNKKYLAIVYDYCELYLPTIVWYIVAV
jgi:hypothetical protein